MRRGKVEYEYQRGDAYQRWNAFLIPGNIKRQPRPALYSDPDSGLSDNGAYPLEILDIYLRFDTAWISVYVSYMYISLYAYINKAFGKSSRNGDRQKSVNKVQYSYDIHSILPVKKRVSLSIVLTVSPLPVTVILFGFAFILITVSVYSSRPW